MIPASPRRGPFVRDRATPPYHATRWERADQPLTAESDAYVSEVRAQGREPRQVFTLRIVSAPVEIAERLRTEEAEPTVVTSLVRYVAGEPCSLQDTYYPMHRAH